MMLSRAVLICLYVVLSWGLLENTVVASIADEIHGNSGALKDSLDAPNIPRSEMDALYDLYQSTGGQNWTWVGNVTEVGSITHTNGIPWNFTDMNANPCTQQWEGLNCSFHPPYETYNIAELVLVDHNLQGELPDSIGNFSKLIALNLAVNKLHGTLPTALRHLSNVLKITLSFNDFHGTIPAVYKTISRMRDIYLNHNRLSGSFPTELAGLKFLRTIALDHNKFTGTIPNAITNYPDLGVLYLDENMFDGSLPDALCRVKTINALHLSSNHFSGTIPSCLNNLTNLAELELQYNALTGTIPDSLTELRYLQLVYVDFNYLTGTIPAAIGNMVGLQTINFQTNILTGSLPPSLGSLLQMTNFYVENNHLTGSIPAEMGMMEQLIFVYMSSNHLIGSLPSTLSKLTHLTSLFLNDNLLTGSLDAVFNATAQPFITTIEISDNTFTGTLPDEVFKISQLSTFAAVSNCFDGSLPQSMCNSPSLTTLILDGLRSAVSCRDAILAGDTSRYVLHNRIEGGVPACLFDVPTLRTLHLSGNGLTGQIPDSVTLHPGLLDLSLSHNELIGTIPLVFQNKRWYNLDLSYNRLSGSLQLNNDWAAVNLTQDYTFYNVTLSADSIALTLRNNRLSGNIPHFVDPIVNISVLDGNLFACNIEQSDLPPHDDGKDTYQCGSNSFNISYYVWLSTLCVLIGGGFLALWFRNQLISSLGLDRVAYYYDKWMHHIEFSPDRDSSVNQHLRNYKYVMYVCAGVCRASLVVTVCILIVLIPIYVATSHYYGTHQFEYAWTVSAAFLSGATAMSLLLICFVALLLVSLVLFTQHIHQYKSSVNEHFRVSDIGQRRTISQRLTSSKTSQDHQRVKVKLRYKILVYFMFFLINTAVVLGVNIVYVYIRLYQSSKLLVIAQLLLSVFKVIWNSFCCVYLIRWTDHYLAESSTLDWREKDSSFFGMQLFVSLFNYIAIPCLVVGTISPDCYQSVMITPSAVSSHFEFKECEVFNPVRGCLHYANKITTTSYNPPFTYSYQCSSSLITFYAPTYVYVSFIVTFLNPVFELAAQKLWQYTRYGKWWTGQLDYWVPLILQLVDKETEKDKAPYDILNPYFDANLLLVTNLTYLGVLLTFGVVFPPLSACLLVSIYANTYNAKMLVGRFTTNAISAGLLKYVEIIEEECEGVGSVPKMYQSLRLLLAFSFCFYTPFLFDTLGDSVGLKGSYWVLFFLPLVVFVGYAIKYTVKIYFPALHARMDRSIDRRESRTSNLRALEMLNVGSEVLGGAAGEGGAEGSGRLPSLELNRIESGDSSQSANEVTFNVLREAATRSDSL